MWRGEWCGEVSVWRALCGRSSGGSGGAVDGGAFVCSFCAIPKRNDLSQELSGDETVSRKITHIIRISYSQSHPPSHCHTHIHIYTYNNRG